MGHVEGAAEVGTVAAAVVGLLAFLVPKQAAAQLQGDACWTQVPGAAVQIAAADGNYPWNIATDSQSGGNHSIWFLGADGFLQTSGLAVDVSAVYSYVDGNNHPAVINAAGTWFLADITGSDYDVTSAPSISWDTSPYSECATSVFLGMTPYYNAYISTIVGCGGGNQEILWLSDDGTADWYDLAYGSGTLVGNATGNWEDEYPLTAWAVNSGDVWKWTSSNGSSGAWMEFYGDAIAISRSAPYGAVDGPTGGAPLIVSSGGYIQYWSGSAWTNVDATTGWSKVDVGANGKVWGIQATSGDIYWSPNLQSDPNNCGSCGTVCGSADGIQGTCVNGACVPPSGWLYTAGNTIHETFGELGSGNPWMGRGVNVDDLFFGGYNGNGSFTTISDAGGTLTTLIANVISEWKPTFMRISLAMDSYDPTVSWLDAGRSAAGAVYKTAMTEVINYIGSQGVYVLVTLRSDQSMIQTYGEGSDIPTPTTDATYQALVDSFASSPYVLFGVSNEPGKDTMVDAGGLASVMTNAVGVIRAEENRLGVPHHLVAVQGIDYTNNLAYYSTSPISSYDNVVYEYHAYATPATPYENIPVIVGEYGPQTAGDNNPGYFDAGAFYANVEGTNAYGVQIPNLAWDVEPYNNIQPDLVQVNYSTNPVPAEPWGPGDVDGGVVKAYLLAHD